MAQQVLRMRLAFGGHEPATQKAVSEAIGRSHPRAQQLEVESLQKLRRALGADEAGTELLNELRAHVLPGTDGAPKRLRLLADAYFPDLRRTLADKALEALVDMAWSVEGAGPPSTDMPALVHAAYDALQVIVEVPTGRLRRDGWEYLAESPEPCSQHESLLHAFKLTRTTMGGDREHQFAYVCVEGAHVWRSVQLGLPAQRRLEAWEVDAIRPTAKPTGW